MKTDFYSKPRKFKILNNKVTITDYGKIRLNKEEMISFKTRSGRECDFTAKEWGFYLGPSLNSRLKKEGFKVALVLNEEGKIYINAVEKDKIALFKKSLKTGQNSKIICWLDELGKKVI